jgi:hypothetical protein
MPPPAPRPRYHAIPDDGRLTLGDYRRYPGACLLLTCALCGWTKPYKPEAVIGRLRQLKAGGHPSPIGPLARRVAWPCPGCGRVKWRMDLAQPAALDAREARRLAGLYRN